MVTIKLFKIGGTVNNDTKTPYENWDFAKQNRINGHPSHKEP